MNKTVFEYRNYKLYLLDWIAQRPKGGRGEKTRIAEHLRCHNAYVSQVLSAEAHFSLEQAEALTQFLSLDREETRFFLLLVELARAGTSTLREFFQTEINRALTQRQTLKNRLHFKSELSQEDRATYYSAWYYTAIHLVVSLSSCQTKEEISEYLHLSTARVAEVLNFLSAAKLIEEVNGRWKVEPTSIHLPDDSPMISKHHSNWRMKAIQSLENGEPGALHYSSVVTIAAEDAPKIKEMMIQAIQSIRGVVRSSANEKMFCYTLDWFEVGQARTKRSSIKAEYSRASSPGPSPASP